jgi:hypothetical protein
MFRVELYVEYNILIPYKNEIEKNEFKTPVTRKILSIMEIFLLLFFLKFYDIE